MSHPLRVPLDVIKQTVHSTPGIHNVSDHLISTVLEPAI
jgi:hypothetical protein